MAPYIGRPMPEDDKPLTLKTMPALVTVEELAGPLKMPVHGIYDLLKKVPPGIVVRLGRRIRVDEAAFIRWMQAGGHTIRPDA